MSSCAHRDDLAGSRDARLRGFADRVSVEEATRWIDERAQLLPGEDIDTAGGMERILAVPIHRPPDPAPGDRAIENGYALRAGETAGASPYNPLYFALSGPGSRLNAGAAALVISGAELPAGADAVLAFGDAEPNGDVLEVFGEAVQGRGVELRGQHAGVRTVLMHPGRCLRPQDLGLLSGLGLDRVRVVRRPRVRLVIAGPKPFGAGPCYDANGPMLRALIFRDGGTVSQMADNVPTRTELKGAMGGEPADAVLVVGRTGTGPDDEAPLALAESGTLALHGIALRPGGSAGMGLVGTIPVILLPGDPLACLSAYELFAGRLIRRMGGRNPDLPHTVRMVEVGRKIVSAIGSVDLCQVRLVGDRVEPIGSAEFGGLAATVCADGFVLVPASLEGYAPGTRVAVRVFAKAGGAETRS